MEENYVTLETLQDLLSGKLTAKEYQYYDSLLNHRTIIFNDVVTDDIVEQVILPLKRFEEDDSNEPIHLLINSPGGSMAGGLILNNIIDHYKKPLEIIVYGYSCSMGTIILCAGNKNPNVTKKCYPFSFFLFHPGSINIETTGANAVMDYMEYQKKVDKMIQDYVVENTNITEEEYKKHIKDEWYLIASEAKEKGLIDEIING